MAASLLGDALRSFGFLALLALIPIGALILFLLVLHFMTRHERGRKPSRGEVARQEERAASERHRQVEAQLLRERVLRADPQWPEAVLDHFLRWLLSRPDERSMQEWMAFRQFQGLQLREREVEEARERARREGLAVHDGRRWRLTARGRRIFEEHGGDRKRMNEAEKKRQQPHIRIDARGAGTVAHTIEGGVHGTTVHHAAAPTPVPAEADLQAVLQLVERLRTALADTDELSDLARQRASGDLGELDRELRAPVADREPGRARAALERLRTTLLGVDGLLEVVNQMWDRLRHWFPA
ncbi:hypothetical protein [Streptomyces sp. PsTaAH-124]|uniref:hypothetical protein n=1 Tax=Streptomyces sp. PsTaAH-124 TaxID=1157638 RepID=UPI00037144CE|nr:hypothetical protein [Streptomyces sp. PsTaAH-124]